MDPPPYSPQPHDFETASIRSAAPSYTSLAPTYTSLLPPRGLPPSSPATPEPPLDAFPLPKWSPTTPHNPASRHYHAVAHRRASALTAQEQASILSATIHGSDAIDKIRRKMEEEERQRNIRTAEDPYLVGEEAAERARQERLRRESGWGVLEMEDKRWDVSVYGEVDCFLFWTVL